ncbi:WEB family protein At2g38370-like isoform X2 [Cicer arietinum]|uniref:WEB family protein At2g38370-like isoform X2 n=1 Tax=Cicer arietinum TaxID=3827 RepID=A0A1S2XRN9_CICAR|nr:WEB family protein At2g38370-like isoform X2 [Cicer arietinum]
MYYLHTTNYSFILLLFLLSLSLYFCVVLEVMNMEPDLIKTTTNRAEPGSSKKNNDHFRTEVDTSAPFESVKEAVNRFGGVGYWKPLYNNLPSPTSHSKHHIEELDGEKLEEQARVLEKELILKERETLDVLKELEKTKRLVEDLKSKLQKEESEANLNNQRLIVEEKEVKENQSTKYEVYQPMKECSIPSHLSSPDLILMELKQAKLNLTKTTHDIADVRATVDSLNKKLEKERISLEKTRERLTQNCSKMSSLEEELNKTRLRLQVAKGVASGDPSDVTVELERLSSEAEHFRKRRESAKLEVLKKMSEIELTTAMIRTAELRLVAARRTKEAARTAEAATIAEIDALSKSINEGSQQECMQKRITLSLEEYTTLTQKARDAEEQSKKRVADAMLEVDEANSLQTNILKRVDEATEEAKTCKKALEEALERVEAADRGKLEVEEALRKWRSDSHKRRSLTNNSTKFKNSGPSEHRRDFRLLDVNGLNLVNDEAKPVLMPTLSIGQILSRKLLMPEVFEGGMMHGERISVKRKVSLGQMLGKHNDVQLVDDQIEKENGQKQFSAKRKKFGFARFSLLLSKQHKKKSKQMLNLR